MPAFAVRRLTEGDADAFRAIRLEGLAREAAAFRSAHADEAGLPPAHFVARLRDSTVFGGEAGGHLLGVAGFARPARMKLRHKGLLWGVYVRPEARGSGLTRALVQAVVDHAASEVEWLHLTNVRGNPAAARLYAGFGFEVYGVESDAVRVDGRSYDEELRAKRLTPPRP